MHDDKDLKNLVRALDRYNIDLDRIEFIERDALYKEHQSVVMHESDRTPVFVDPESAGDHGPRERCQIRQSSRDIGGVAKTNTEGHLLWRLSDYVCDTIGGYEEPISFVATANRSTPVIMTCKVRSVGHDIQIDVWSWEVSGDPAPSVRFSWRCWAVGGGIIVD